MNRRELLKMGGLAVLAPLGVFLSGTSADGRELKPKAKNKFVLEYVIYHDGKTYGACVDFSDIKKKKGDEQLKHISHIMKLINGGLIRCMERNRMIKPC